MQEYTFSPRDKVIIKAHGPQPLVKGLLGYKKLNQHHDDHKVALFIERGVIAAVSRIPADASRELPPGWRVIELPRDYLLAPPLVDCHVHLSMDGVNGFKGLTKPVENDLLEARLKLLSQAGLGAVRDGGDRFNLSLKAAGISSTLSRSNFIPRVIATGSAIFRRGYYGRFLGREGIAQVEEVDILLKNLKEEGAQQAKVILSGLVNINNPGKPGPIQFSQEELNYIVKKAGEHGLPVMAHVNSDEGIMMAASAGVHTIEHGYFISRNTLQFMAEKGIGWVPTLAPLWAFTKTSSAEQASKIQDILKNHAEKIAAAADLGVTVGLGTDAGAPGVGFDSGFSEEMQLLSHLGLDPLQILLMATVNGSLLLDIPRERGEIEPNKPPCFIALKREVLRGLENFNRPEAVFYIKNGKHIS